MILVWAIVKDILVDNNSSVCVLSRSVMFDTL